MADAPITPPTPPSVPVAFAAQPVPVPPTPPGGFYIETPTTYPPFPPPPLPASPPNPPPPPFAAPPMRARDLRQEYVTTAQRPWWLPAQRLPWPVDDATAEFGDDLYERMLVDPQVAACLNVLKASILQDGVQLKPPLDDREDADYGRSRQLCALAERMFADMEVSLNDTLWDMLDGLALGNRVAELKYTLFEEPPGYDGGALLNLTAVKPKPRRTTAFVVDNYGNVLGLLGLPPYTSPALLTIDLNVLQSPFLLPRHKFAVFSFRPKNADPRGTSILRPAYAPWFRKQQLWPEYIKYLSQFGGASLVLTSAPQASPQYVVDPDTGEPLEGQAPVSPQDLLLQAATQWRNGFAMAVPFGTKVEAIQPPGDGKAFTDAYKMCNLEITKAILTQNLATEEGEHQARAAADVHQDVLGTIIRQGKQALERCIAYDLLRPWVLYNWGPDAVDLTPVASLGSTEPQDLSHMWGAAAALTTAQYLTKEQLPAVDEMLGLPVRDLNAVDAGTDVPAGGAPPPPPPPPPAPGLAPGFPPAKGATGAPGPAASGPPGAGPPPAGPAGKPNPFAKGGSPPPAAGAPGSPPAPTGTHGPAGGGAPPPKGPPAPAGGGPGAAPPTPPPPPAAAPPPPKKPAAKLPKPTLDQDAVPEPPGRPEPPPNQVVGPDQATPLAPDQGMVSPTLPQLQPVRQPLEAPRPKVTAGGRVVVRPGKATLSQDRTPRRALPTIDFARPAPISDAELADARAWAARILAGTPHGGILDAAKPPPPPPAKRGRRG